MGVPALPNELKLKLCSFLPVPEVKNIRFANKVFRDYGAEFLIPEVHIVFAFESFQRLKNIASHQLICKSVRSIVYEGDRLKPLDPSLSIWEKNEADKTQEERELELYERSYIALVDEQREMEAKQEYGRDIAFAITKFPNLNDLQLYVYATRRNKLRQFEKYYTERLNLPKGMQFTIGSRTPQKAEQSGIIWQSIGKSAKTPKLESLVLDYVSMDSFRLSSLIGPSFWSPVIGGLRKLRVLIDEKRDYEADAHEEPRFFKHMLETGRFRTFLLAAPHLESLDIQIRKKVRDSREVADISLIFGGNTWEHLKAVRLHFCASRSSALLDFLERHRATLEHVTLKTHEFEAGDYRRVWGHFLLQVRNMKRWKTFEISDHCGCGNGPYVYITPFHVTPGTADYSEEVHRLFVGIPSFVSRQIKYNPFFPGLIPGVEGPQEREVTKYDAHDASSDEED